MCARVSLTLIVWAPITYLDNISVFIENLALLEYMYVRYYMLLYEYNYMNYIIIM